VARTIVSMERSYVTAAFFRHRTYERYRAQQQQQTAARLLGEGGRPPGAAAFLRPRIAAGCGCCFVVIERMQDGLAQPRGACAGACCPWSRCPAG